MINLRIVYVDHYMSKPILNLDPLVTKIDKQKIDYLPVIRVFGTTNLGQKCCTHIHGFFPYLTIEKKNVEDYSIGFIVYEINKILNDVYNKDKSTLNHIYHVDTIESKSFYGFRLENQIFYRIYFLNPRSVKIVFKLIKQNRLFEKQFNVYEAHFSYIMQFFVNFKLSGMNFLTFDKYKERRSKDKRTFSKNGLYFINQDKQTICKLEYDLITKNIIVNKNHSKFINPGLVLIWQEEQQRLIDSNKKNIKNLFEGNLKDCGKRIYEKGSLERAYLEQLENYLSYKDNFDFFDNKLHDSLNIFNSNNEEYLDYLNNSFSQNAILRLIENENQLIRSSQNDTFCQNNILSDKNQNFVNKKDLCSQEFSVLMKNLKKQGKNDEIEKILDNIQNDSDSDSSSDELNVEKEKKFISIIMQSQKSKKSLSQNIPTIKLSETKDETYSEMINIEDFNLDNESVIDYLSNDSDIEIETKNLNKKSNSNKKIKKDKNLIKIEFFDSIMNSKGKKRKKSYLSSFKDEPLFCDDDIKVSSLKSNSSQSSQLRLSQKSLQNSQPKLSQSSNSSQSFQANFSQPSSSSQQSHDKKSGSGSSQTENQIFSFYSLGNSSIEKSEIIETQKDFLQVPSLKRRKIKNNSESTPIDQNKLSPQNVTKSIKKNLKNKFLKLKDESNLSFENNLNDSNISSNSSKITQSKSFVSTEEKVLFLNNSIREDSQNSNLKHENQNLTIMTMELFATTDHEIKPNPISDSIKMLFYYFYKDLSKDLVDKNKQHFIGIIIQETVTGNSNDLSITSSQKSLNTTIRKSIGLRCLPMLNSKDEEFDISFVNSEMALIEKFIEILIKFDPDIISGYEIETSSWGYLISRAEILKIDSSVAFSRLLIDSNKNKTNYEKNEEENLSDMSDIDDDICSQNLTKNQLLTNNFLNRNRWQTVEKMKKEKPDFGSIKCREDLRKNLKNDTLVKQFETIYSLSFVSPCYMNITGRIMLNLWRVTRKEIALNSFTFESVYYELFKKRVPYFTCKQLTKWLFSKNEFFIHNILNYFITRIKGNLEIIDKLGIVNTTSELARVFGIQFSDVISKGSQFRVESLLYRSTIEFEDEPSLNENITLLDLDDEPLSSNTDSQKNEFAESQKIKKQKFMLLSCNFNDRLKQSDPQIIPYVMEPKIGFYKTNVAVLDFQSLYPSIMIAYNYCYSTCLGQLDYIKNNIKEFPFGFSKIEPSLEFIENNLENINISPNGVLFVNQNIKKGILSSILEEILDTRLMVKKCLKIYNNDEEKLIAKMLDARQLGLKLLANVTYGYTAAGFSGRMPCIDLADSIISKARETLINSINFINNNENKFGGKVIYGDTDSMFVEFNSDISFEKAFENAQKLCELITLSNPNPVKLKLEKIYTKCILLSKKRYAGYAYETPQQEKPKFEAKGFEIVRRDTIGLVKRVLEKCVRILFEKNTATDIKPYLEYQFYKTLHENNENLHEYIFAKEYRGIFGYRPGTYIPSMEISKQIVNKYGEHCRPFIKERVPYIITYSDQINDPLFKLVKHPLDFLREQNLRINSSYYIERILIPPLQRVFGLLNVNIKQWFTDLPKKAFYVNAIEKQNLCKLVNYFHFVKCLICDRKFDNTKENMICQDCLTKTQNSSILLLEKTRIKEKYLAKSNLACLNCTKMNCLETRCKSIDCYNLFRQNRLTYEYNSTKDIYDMSLKKLTYQFQKM